MLQTYLSPSLLQQKATEMSCHRETIRFPGPTLMRLKDCAALGTAHSQLGQRGHISSEMPPGVDQGFSCCSPSSRWRGLSSACSLHLQLAKPFGRRR